MFTIVTLSNSIVTYFYNGYHPFPVIEYLSNFSQKTTIYRMSMSRVYSLIVCRPKAKVMKNDIRRRKCSQKGDIPHTNSSMYFFPVTRYFFLSFPSNSNNITASSKKSTFKFLSVYLR